MIKHKSKKTIYTAILVAIILLAAIAIYSVKNTPKKSSITNSVQASTNSKLSKLNWAPDTNKSLQSLIDSNGKHSKNYNLKNKPYAVFDWDNTSILNDTGEAFYMYQLQNLEFKMTPEELSKVIRKNIPKTNFDKDFNNKSGKSVNIDLIGEDIDSDYSYIYKHYKNFKGTKDLKAIKSTPQYKDFLCKMWYLYKAIGDSFSADVSYPWVTYMCSNMTKNEVMKLAEKSNDFALKDTLEKRTLTSPENLPGKAGVVSISYKSGIRTLKEQQNLYKTLRDNGIDVYICSASFVDIVRCFSSNPKYNYNIPEDHVLGMELEKTKEGKILPIYRKGYDQTQGEGKAKNIKRFLVKKYNHGPILIGGDSSGDVAMMTSFKDTQKVLIVNRAKGDKLGELSKEAASSIGKKDAKYLLQGRDENKGSFRPSEKSIFLGKTEEKLLK